MIGLNRSHTVTSQQLAEQFQSQMQQFMSQMGTLLTQPVALIRPQCVLEEEVWEGGIEFCLASLPRSSSSDPDGVLVLP